MVRFTQKIYKDDHDEPHVQWRGTISHVQSGEQKKFAKVEDALSFIQNKLAELTLSSTEERTQEEQESILAKSREIWKMVTQAGPQIVKETLKDPKKQISQIQEQIQEQITHVSDEISQKIDVEKYLSATKSDFKTVVELLDELRSQIGELNKKVDRLSRKIKQ